MVPISSNEILFLGGRRIDRSFNNQISILSLSNLKYTVHEHRSPNYEFLSYCNSFVKQKTGEYNAIVDDVINDDKHLISFSITQSNDLLLFKKKIKKRKLTDYQKILGDFF